MGTGGGGTRFVFGGGGILFITYQKDLLSFLKLLYLFINFINYLYPLTLIVFLCIQVLSHMIINKKLKI